MNPTEKELRELDAWIEINVFNQKVFSEIRGEFEWFYFADPEKMSRREKEKYKPREWSDYDPMKHVLPNGQPRRFSTNPADAMAVLKKCAEKQDVMLGFNNHGKRWAISKCSSGLNSGYTEAPTLELAIARFARKVFEK